MELTVKVILTKLTVRMTRCYLHSHVSECAASLILPTPQFTAVSWWSSAVVPSPVPPPTVISGTVGPPSISAPAPGEPVSVLHLAHGPVFVFSARNLFKSVRGRHVGSSMPSSPACWVGIISLSSHLTFKPFITVYIFASSLSGRPSNASSDHFPSAIPIHALFVSAAVHLVTAHPSASAVVTPVALPAPSVAALFHPGLLSAHGPSHPHFTPFIPVTHSLTAVTGIPPHAARPPPTIPGSHHATFLILTAVKLDHRIRIHQTSVNA